MVFFPPPSFDESRLLPSAAALARRTSSADTASPKRFVSLPRRSFSTRGPVRLDRLLKFTMMIAEFFLASLAYSVDTRRLCCRCREGSGWLPFALEPTVVVVDAHHRVLHLSCIYPPGQNIDEKLTLKHMLHESNEDIAMGHWYGTSLVYFCHAIRQPPRMMSLLQLTRH